MDMIFTHFGVSGPAALRWQFVYKEQKSEKQDIQLQLDVFQRFFTRFRK